MIRTIAIKSFIRFPMVPCSFYFQLDPFGFVSGICYFVGIFHSDKTSLRRKRHKEKIMAGCIAHYFLSRPKGL